MTGQAKLLIKNTSGTKIAELTATGQNGILRLVSWRKVNHPGALTVEVSGNAPIVTSLADKYQFVYQRRYPLYGIDWYSEFDTIYRDEDSFQTDEGEERFLSTSYGLLHTLEWREVAYDAGVTGRTKFSSIVAETVMKELVKYNATASGTVVDGRDRLATITGLTIQADAGGGNTISWECSRRKLLSDLQEIALIGGGDFDLVRSGVAGLDFRFYAGQLGTDRTATVVFAPERGNMANPHLLRNRASQATVAIVGGQGLGTARNIRVVTGADYSATNDIETFVDARKGSLNDYLDKVGDSRLAQMKQETQQLTFDVLQTPSTLYGMHYFLGDLVTGKYKNVTQTYQVYEVVITYEPGDKETVDIRLRSFA